MVINKTYIIWGNDSERFEATMYKWNVFIKLLLTSSLKDLCWIGSRKLIRGRKGNSKEPLFLRYNWGDIHINSAETVILCRRPTVFKPEKKKKTHHWERNADKRSHSYPRMHLPLIPSVKGSNYFLQVIVTGISTAGPTPRSLCLKQNKLHWFSYQISVLFW